MLGVLQGGARAEAPVVLVGSALTCGEMGDHSCVMAVSMDGLDLHPHMEYKNYGINHECMAGRGPAESPSRGACGARGAFVESIESAGIVGRLLMCGSVKENPCVKGV